MAPEGWIAGEALRALAGGPRVRLPGRARRAGRVVAVPGRHVADAAGPAAVDDVHPWVVAADRLRALGWSATHTNEEAFVAGHRPSPWATVSPRRRQELALGVSAASPSSPSSPAAVDPPRVRRSRRVGVSRGARRG